MTVAFRIRDRRLTVRPTDASVSLDAGPAWPAPGRWCGGDFMIRGFVVATLLVSGVLTAAVGTAGAGDDRRGLRMAFELRREGPADVCGSKCRSWISAVGSITAETPRQ